MSKINKPMVEKKLNGKELKTITKLCDNLCSAKTASGTDKAKRELMRFILGK